ncbi:MAG: hypothetical protein QXN07_00185 [Candidatus Caldarchaeum sp.]
MNSTTTFGGIKASILTARLSPSSLPSTGNSQTHGTTLYATPSQPR